MKKVKNIFILILMLASIITANAQVGSLPFAIKWLSNYHTWSDPQDPVLIANDLITLKNYINTNGSGNVTLTGNNPLVGNNTFGGSST